MADDNKTMAVRPGDDLSNVLATLEGLHARMDSLEVGAGSRNPIKGDEEKIMAAKNDEEKEEEKEEEKKKDDAEEEKEEEKKEKADDDEGEQEEGKKPPAIVADKKRKDQVAPPSRPAPAAAKKDDGEGRDAEEDKDKKRDAKRDDEDDDDKRRDAAIADAVEQNRTLERRLSEQDKLIAKLTAMIKPRSDEEHAAFADAQAKADAVFEGFGKQAPRPLEGESLLNYRKRLATALRPHSQTWQKVPFSTLGEEAFAIAESQVYADAARSASTASNLGEGEMREVTRTNPRTGLKTTVFYGADSFVKEMGSQPRLARIITEQPRRH
jgi:hypothetical protein